MHLEGQEGLGNLETEYVGHAVPCPSVLGLEVLPLCHAMHLLAVFCAADCPSVSSVCHSSCWVLIPCGLCFLCLSVSQAKLARRVANVTVKILSPPRPGKKCLVLDIDYTIFDLNR